MAGLITDSSVRIQDRQTGKVSPTQKIVEGATGGTFGNDITGSTPVGPNTAGTVTPVDSATPVEITINSNLNWEVGNTVAFIQKGVGSVTFVAGAGVTINSYSGSLALSGQYALGGLVYCGNDEWITSGQMG